MISLGVVNEEYKLSTRASSQLENHYAKSKLLVID